MLTLSLLMLFSCQESKEERLERETREYTQKNCPEKIDEYVTLDSLVYHNDGSGNYYYYYSVEADSEAVAMLAQHKPELRKEHLGRIRNSVDMKHIKQMGLSINILYHDHAAHRLILDFLFTPSEYDIN